MGVGAEEGGDATVEVPAEGNFLRGGFAVEVEEDYFCGDLAEQLVGFAEGIVAGGHEDAALKVHDGIGLAGGEFALVDTEAGCADGVVGGAEDAAAANVGVDGNGHVFEDLALVPDVVAGGDDVCAEIEELFCDRRGDAKAASGVFSVDYEEVDGVGFKDVREVFADDVAAGGAKDIADKKDVHLRSLHGGAVEKWR